jgi:hypothetical protein
MSFFHFILGASALGASSGMRASGAGAVAGAQVAALDAVTRAVEAGIIPPPPQAPPPPPPSPHWDASYSKTAWDMIKQQHYIAQQFHNAAVYQYEEDMKYWQTLVKRNF